MQQADLRIVHKARTAREQLEQDCHTEAVDLRRTAREGRGWEGLAGLHRAEGQGSRPHWDIVENLVGCWPL